MLNLKNALTATAIVASAFAVPVTMSAQAAGASTGTVVETATAPVKASMADDCYRYHGKWHCKKPDHSYGGNLQINRNDTKDYPCSNNQINHNDERYQGRDCGDHYKKDGDGSNHQINHNY
ncbi:hypothetical protein [Nonomuraea africana]|uniref:Uncharacterized protein n=1 Tax=Nonomuraea africana TaxID=46171 RepID=A0ABR9KML4_9ACTN|nr:hypothetical protein [Nonomuraea africana]MBE1563257.1 hypothetical protein [Nonomuraea africana]